MLADSTDGQVRQAGADHDQRAVALRQFVARRAQRRDVGRRDVLHLVHEERDADAQVGRHRGGVGEQLGEVDLEVAGIGAAADCRGVDAELGDDRRPWPLGIARRERLEDAEEVIDPLGRPVPWRQLAHGHVQGARYGPPDRLVRPRLELAGAPEPLHRHRPERVEQHGLAHSAQPGQHHAALGAAASHPLEHDLELADLAVPPR